MLTSSKGQDINTLPAFTAAKTYGLLANAMPKMLCGPCDLVLPLPANTSKITGMLKALGTPAERVLLLSQVAENAAAVLHGQWYPESLSKAAASQIPLQTKVQTPSQHTMLAG